MHKDLDAPTAIVTEKDPKTFTITTVDGKSSYIDGENIKDIFGKIDGLRLEGKRWLETYDFYLADQIHKIYVNIDHIVSVQ